MTGNPLSGHTKANESTMAGTATFTDGLTDGDHIQSPTLTNYLEGLHGNGVLLEEDTAYGATNRNVPEDLPGVVEQNTNSDRIRVTGGTAVIDGVPFQFAGGPGSHIDIDLTTTSPNRRATYSALTSGQEALVVVYVSTKDSEGGSAVNNVQWEMGTAITTATNAYPTTPSAFLNDPKAATGLATDSTSFQSVVLAVLRVVYSASAPGDLKISVTESNDKRVFIRPSPIYLTSVTDGIVGATTAIDSHAEVDALITGTTGDLAGSRLGALWQSYNADGDTILYYSSKDSGGTRHTHVLGPVGYVTKSPSATTTFTFNEGQVFVLNPSTAMQFNPSGTFPLGHLVYVTNEAAHGTNGVTFDNAGIGIVLLGKESGVFVYTGSAWKNVMLASGAVSPNGHGASGNVQLSDGGGGFTSDNNLNFNTSTDALTVNDLKISSSSNDVTIENETQDKDLIFKVNDGGSSTEVMRIDGDVARVGIGLDDPAGKLHVRTTDVDYAALFETTDDSASAAPDVALYRNSATPANGDDLGHLIWRGVETDGVTLTRGNYADIFCEAQVVTTGSESGKMHLRTKLAGTMNKRISIAATETIINEDSVDANFRVESDGNANMLFVDAGSNEVGIGTNSPVATLDVASGSTFRNTRLLTVSVSASTTLTEAAHAGRYNICAGNITLPSTSTAGEHYAILNTTGGDITIGRNGNNINGAGSDFTLGTYKAATCIAIGSNNWMVVG